MNENNIAISVVIPIYNGVSFFPRLVDTLKQQTFKNFEVLFIDDASTDDSIAVLKQLIEGDERFRIYEVPHIGVAQKNVAFSFSKLKGEYYFYMFQDDWLSEDLFQNMYDKAMETHADSVIPDMIWAFDDDVTKGIFPPQNNYQTELSGKDAFVLSLDWSIHGFGIKKTDMFIKYWLETDSYNQDEFNERLFLLNAEKIVFCQGKFYYYQGNKNAITKKFSHFLFDWLETDNNLFQLVEKYSLGTQVKKKIFEIYLNEFLRLQEKFENNFQLLENEQQKKCLQALIKHRKLLCKYCIKTNFFSFKKVIKMYKRLNKTLKKHSYE